MNSAVEMKHIRKSFNGVPVLKGVDFSLARGEIHALMGENGAGKSTLMNILGGVLQPDEGEIYVGGQRVTVQSPRESQAMGVSFIHQELNLVNDLRIYENLFLGSELTNRYGLLDERTMCERAAAILNRLGVALDPKTYVSDLDASIKQIVEIAKSLLKNAKVIIMDEPTASLTDKETENLFSLMSTLKQSGVSIIFISHKLKEVFRICDRYTVLRDGEVVSSGDIASLDEATMARLMLGKDVSSSNTYQPRELGDIALEVRGLSNGRVRGASFYVCKGEVVGFTGLTGDGRTELFECIFGYRRGYVGEIYIHGRKCHPAHPSQALAYGVGLVPKNRKENAIVKDMSVLHNMTLTAAKKFQRFFWIDSSRERAQYEVHREQLNIKAKNPDLSITSLSGGNQQKVVLSKWLAADSSILILDNPTQGVDIGAKQEIHHLIGELAGQGKAIVVLSSEVPEILKICDRIYVMHQGSVVAELPRSEATEDKILMLASGIRDGKAEEAYHANY